MGCLSTFSLYSYLLKIVNELGNSSLCGPSHSIIQLRSQRCLPLEEHSHMGSLEAFLLFTRQVKVEMRCYARDLIFYIWDTESLGNTSIETVKLSTHGN